MDEKEGNQKNELPILGMLNWLIIFFRTIRFENLGHTMIKTKTKILLRTPCGVRRNKKQLAIWRNLSSKLKEFDDTKISQI